MLQREREAVGPSRPTQTVTVTPTPDEAPIPAGTLRLRGHHTDDRRVAWTENTIDNEKLGRKSSKICCIYHKPKNFDESSSDESSSSSDSEDTGDEHESAMSRDLKQKIREKKRNARVADHDHAHETGPCDQTGSHQAKKRQASPSSEETIPDRNAYEKGVR